jgi:hypothetical protein
MHCTLLLFVLQASRKAPECAPGFRVACNKWLILVRICACVLLHVLLGVGWPTGLALLCDAPVWSLCFNARCHVNAPMFCICPACCYSV